MKRRIVYFRKSNETKEGIIEMCGSDSEWNFDQRLSNRTIINKALNQKNNFAIKKGTYGFKLAYVTGSFTQTYISELFPICSINKDNEKTYTF